MNNYVIIGIAAVVAVMIMRALQSRADSSSAPDPTVPRTADGVKQLLAAGHPIRAMKLAEEIAAGDPAKAQALMDELGIRVRVSGTGDAASVVAGMLGPAQDRQFQALMLSGNKIEAIKRWRELTGHGLKEAKDAVDALSKEEPPST